MGSYSDYINQCSSNRIVTTHDLGKCIVDYLHHKSIYINFLGNMMLHTIGEDKVHLVRDGDEDSLLEVWLSNSLPWL